MDGSDGGVGSWSPAPAAAPDGALLRRLALAWQTHREALVDLLTGDTDALAPDAGSAEDAPTRSLVAGARAAMQQPRGALDAPAAELDAGTLEALVRLFTLLENRPGWAAGAASPVVPLFRSLRMRVQGDEPAAAAVDVDALAAWVKRHSDNRFLPWGSLQDRLR